VVEELTTAQNVTDLAKAVVVLRDDAREQHGRRVKEIRYNDETWDNSEYKDIQILPQWDEVCVQRKPPRLRKSIVSGSYIDWLHYYDIQFRLLREDFVAPLRNGVCDYLNGMRGRKLRSVRVYKNVLIQEPVFRDSGICYKIKLDFSSMRRRCNWEHSKRLLYGSLLCLSPEEDNFTDEVYFATVTNRESEKIANGELEVMFQGGEAILNYSSSGASFVVVESCAYFEASQHILLSLQKAEKEVDTMPFKKYLILGECHSVDQPKYLAEGTEYNLSFILTIEERSNLAALGPESKHLDALRIWNDDSGSDEDEQKSTLRQTLQEITVPLDRCLVIPDVADLSNWPTVEQTELDNSQLAGLRMALTQEIAVIQGPPGTGKTYIGLKIVEALLNNKRVWNTGGTRSPILVMCFTNHALDQFLEGILECPLYKDTAPEDLKLIRIGGRCKSEKLTKFNLRSMKREIHLPGDVLHRKFDAQDRVKDFRSSISEYGDTRGNNKLISLDDLQAYNVILAEHYSALFFLLGTEPQSLCALEIWLGLVDTDDPRFNAWTDQSAESIMSEETSNPPEANNVKHGTAHEDQQEEATADGDDKALIDVTGEATVEQAGRLIDDAENHVVKEVKFTSHSSDYTKFVRYLNGLVLHAGCADPRTKTSVLFNQSKAELNLRSIFSVKPMPKSEYNHLRNIFSLPIKDRHRLYQYWHKQYLQHLRQACEREFQEYSRLCREQDEARKAADRYAFETAEIIGMTTTGAAKYQHILHLVKPRIVIVEEAAEVLESHIVSALNAGTQHLILIGDHKQLRPKPNEYELAKKYNLDVSLFERLVRNGFPHATLEFQHRMRPEIAQLVKPHIYTTLSNHPSVEDYPDVRGVSTNLFFISHQHEEKEDENLMSHSNAHEASYLVNLCKYLLQQRYEPRQITILVTYSGQLLAIRKLMPRDEFEGVRISTVDNFQGEENDIILLSLVRSNSENNVGFLSEENRICVALSRARMGFYCIGNFTMLREKVQKWDDIMSDMEEEGKIGRGLLLHCSNHQEINFVAKDPQDFAQNSPKGGCLKDCTFRLACGHVCDQKCHYTDPTHTEFRCKKPCTKSCEEGHPCRYLCYQSCICKVRMTRSMPGCDHDQEMYCHENPSSLDCISPCKEQCPKGHPCPLKCHEVCEPCVVKVSVSMPGCRHQQLIECGQNIYQVKCIADCSRKCENGHPCPYRCYELCGTCIVPVVKTIPECKHQIQLPCHIKPRHEECTKPCEQLLPCSHKCRLTCGEVCSSRACEVKVTVELPECGHEIPVACHTSHDPSVISCTEKCTRPLPCGHPCGLKCSEPCKTECHIQVNKVWPCGHKLKRACYQTATPEDYPCNSKCKKVLDCGHPCPKPCGVACVDKCQEMVEKMYPCGHIVIAPCSSTPSEAPCKMLCAYILACGHKCSGKCSECTSKHIHPPCTFKIGMKRFCGHTIQVPCCSGLSDSHPGRKTITISCCHGAMEKGCSDRNLNACGEPCDWSCAHHECRNLCSENCDRPICDERCMERLKCGHQCHGLCGEPCLSFCPQCQLKKFNKKLKSPGHFKSECTYYELPCTHVFSVEYLDNFVQAAVNPKSDLLVAPLQCPVMECHQLFSCSYRYGNHMKQMLSHVQRVNDIIRPASANSSVGVDEKTLQRRIKEIIDSDDMVPKTGLPANHFLSSFARDKNQYKPMQSITSTILGLRPQQVEKSYIFAHMFVEALTYLQALTPHQPQSPHLVSDYKETLKEVKRFLKFLSSILETPRHGNFKLTYQLIIDSQKELLRLSFHVYIVLAKCGNMASGKALEEAESYLRSISAMTSKINKSEFRRHMDMIGRLIPFKTGLSYRSSIEEMDKFHPAVHKGQWWRCSEGHFYCSPPSILDHVVLKCPHCNLGKTCFRETGKCV
jgi:hypothetical protein